MEVKKKTLIKLNKETYVKEIESMINEIDDLKLIKRIYKLVQYVYVKGAK